MSDYPMLISNKLHSFRNFDLQNYRNHGQIKECSQISNKNTKYFDSQVNL